MKPLVIRNQFALGDTVCLSAAVRDLHRAFPGQYRVSMAGHYLSYWKHDPAVQPIDPALRAPVHDLTYRDGIGASQSGAYRKHFLTWMHRWLGRQLRVEIPVTEPRGAIHLPPGRDRRLFEGRYWVVVAGGKTDMTAKWWLFERWQTVVDQLAARGIACVQAGANFHQNVHPVLRGCRSAVDKTNDIVDLFALIKHAEGVLCGITAAMHIAAVYDKPCVVVAGGREEPTWEAYTNSGQWPEGCARVKIPHRFLHTVTLLDCCRQYGCWKTRTVAIEPSDLVSVQSRSKLCQKPVRGKQTVPECMTLIHPEDVVEAVMGYYEDGTLPPVKLRPPALEPEFPGTKPPPPIVETHRPAPAEVVPAGHRAGEDPAFRVLDHPTIGGRYTAFLLCYGPHFDLAKRCLESLLDTVPAARLDIRVALNQVEGRTMSYFQELHAAGAITRLYPDAGTRRKYPAMRTMFHDPGCPIRTRYVLWFDDDAVCVDKRWIVKLSETIVANHPHGARLYGAKFHHDLALYAKDGHRPDLWFRQAPWWRDEPLRLRGHPGRTGPNGSVIEFVSGWFWALAAETIVAAGIPDTRLNHNGGDACIGEQVHQAGYRIKEFNTGKASIWCPTREKGGRRGYSESFPWAAPAV